MEKDPSLSYIGLVKPSELSSVDLGIVGGGINGAGLALQAAHAGLSVALFEKKDFASGTSSRSTKLIHGGIRYLEQGRFSLVFEALHERARLLREAPHLVRPIPFLLPTYKGDTRPAWLLRSGLWLYDLLAGPRNLQRHQWLSPAQALALAPPLKQEGLAGCGLYFDAQVNDARLVLENILAAEAAGAACFNHCPVLQLGRERDGIRVFYHDEREGGAGSLHCRVLVNASGPWVNGTAAMLSEDPLKRVRPTRGTHIIVPRILGSHALLVTVPEDGRVIFIIPWRGESLIGTTDLDDPGDPDLVRPTEEEIEYLLRQARRILPSWDGKRGKVISAFAGLRPLAWAEGDRASSVSREDRIIDEGRVLTIVGGKLTTYHSMARKALVRVCRTLGRTVPPPSSPSLPGTPEGTWEGFLERETSLWPQRASLSREQVLHMAFLYGRRGSEVAALMADPALQERLHPDRPETLAQVRYAVRSERALHLDDVLLRRLEVGTSPQRWGPVPEKASHEMSRLLGWDERARREELDRYRRALFPEPAP